MGICPAQHCLVKYEGFRRKEAIFNYMIPTLLFNPLGDNSELLVIMVSRKHIDQSNAKITADTAPNVVVSVGGTSGIGQATLIQLVSLGLPTRIYIVGRNEAHHRLFIEKLRQTNSHATIVWLEGQISLLSEVRRLCDEIRKLEPSVDLLLLSAGYLPFGPRQGGLDMGRPFNLLVTDST